MGSGVSASAIFLSYASQDAQAARRICEALRAVGLEVWFDQSELRGGDAWDASIRKQVKECALFVPVVSANTDARSEGYFRLEWKLAVDRSHLMAQDQAFLMPVVIDATPEPTARVPDAFRERQWSRLTDDRSMAAFAERVGGILSGGAHPARDPVSAATPAAAAPEGADVPSIAVLAFANRSSDPNDEYFSDGLADELLNVLAKIRGLRVAARTSSFQFKGKNEDISAIGRKLHVSTVLEGSVRKSGNRVRISVQLVKVADGYHLWSETYDRTLDDIFAVQDDIASAVVQGLRETLLVARPDAAAAGQVTKEIAEAARGRSENPEAYRLYLQGRFLVERLTGPDISRGIECLQAAIALDPEFALAHAAQSRAHTYEGGWGLRTPQDATALARAAALRSLALEPDLFEGLLALGTLQMWHDWDWAGARASLGRARELAPGKPEVLRDYGMLMYLTGRFEEAYTHGRRAIELDPLNAIGHLYLSLSLLALGKLREAESTCRKALEISPDGISFRYCLAMVLDAEGKREEAIAESLLDKADWSRLTSLACLYHLVGRTEESASLLSQLKETSADLSAFQIAQVHAVRGESDQSFAWLERAFDQRDAGVSMVRSCPWFDLIKGDPRWEEFLRKVGLAD
jgi:TolB-like protein/tetratricopeptide (TPR) repeat protein